MKIMAICIASAFETRGKIDNRLLLKSAERSKAAVLLDTLDTWRRKSQYNPEVSVISEFDEIRELCIHRHIKCLINDFDNGYEAGMIRSGLLSFGGSDAYIIISASETSTINEEILEKAIDAFVEDKTKVVIAKIDGRPTYPVVFSSEYPEPVISLIERSGSKSTFKTSIPNSSFFDASQILASYVVHSGEIAVNVSVGSSDSTNDLRKIKNIAIIRGGGRVGSAIAYSLKKAGFCVLISEKEKPDTIFQGKTFAQAVYNTQTVIGEVSAYVTSPVLSQIEKAWDAGVIPVIVDPEFLSPALLSSDNAPIHLARELDMHNTSESPLAYLTRGENSDSNIIAGGSPNSYKLSAGYRISAIIDCTPQYCHTVFGSHSGVFSLGIYGKRYGNAGPDYLVDTSISSRIGHISLYTQSADIRAEQQKPCDIYELVNVTEEGTFITQNSIGQEIKIGDELGRLQTGTGNSIAIVATVNGRLVGCKRSGGFTSFDETVAAIDCFADSYEACHVFTPFDAIIGDTVCRAALAQLKWKA